MATETYEYAYLTVLNVSDLTAPGRQEWVGLLQSEPGNTIYADADSALRILNQLGQEGWIVGDARHEKVEKNDLPGWLVSAMHQRFGLLGAVHTRATHFLTRRLQWNDPA